jgi:hypothetical protein
MGREEGDGRKGRARVLFMMQHAHRIMQWGFLPLDRVRRAARVAYWKTSRTPSPVLAEHSR